MSFVWVCATVNRSYSLSFLSVSYILCPLFLLLPLTFLTFSPSSIPLLSSVLIFSQISCFLRVLSPLLYISLLLSTYSSSVLLSAPHLSFPLFFIVFSHLSYVLSSPHIFPLFFRLSSPFSFHSRRSTCSSRPSSCMSPTNVTTTTSTSSTPRPTCRTSSAATVAPWRTRLPANPTFSTYASSP